MREINGRFRLLEQINENNNFLVYRAEDVLEPGRMLILKITASEDKFQTDLMYKEFMAGAYYRHPLLRHVKALHRLRSVDGRFLESRRTFYIADYYPGLFTLNRDSECGFMNGIYAFMRFLHSNDTYHGDLRVNNILAGGDGPVFFDMSPLFVNEKMGLRNDLINICSMMRTLDYELPAEAERNVLESNVMKASVSDKRQREILLSHMAHSPFPSSLILSKRGIGAIPGKRSGLNVYDYRSAENARSWYEGLLPFLEGAGYEKYDIPGAADGLAEAVCGTLSGLLYFNGENIGDKEFSDEAEKVFFCIDKVLSFGPVLLALGPARRFSDNDLELISLMERHYASDDLVFAFYSDKRLACVERNLAQEPLNEGECRDAVAYYAYLLKDHGSSGKELFDSTGGEPALAASLFRGIADGDCINVRGGVGNLEKGRDCFRITFDIGDEEGPAGRGLERAVALVKAMGGKMPLCVYEHVPGSLRDVYDRLIKKGAAYADERFFNIRLPVLLKHGDKPDAGVAREIESFLQDRAFTEIDYLESYVFLSLNSGSGAAVYKKASHFYSTLSERKKSENYELFFRIFQHFDRFRDELNGINLFDLYFHINKMDFNSMYEHDYILEQMKKYADTPERKIICECTRLTYDENASLADAEALLPVMDKLFAKKNGLWAFVLQHYMHKLKFLGEYEKLEEIYGRFKERLEGVSPEYKMSVLNEMFSSYMDKMQLPELRDTSARMLAVVEKYPDDLGESSLFTAYNNQAIVLRRSGETEEALKYYDKGLEIAERLKNYRYIGIVSINIGVIHYYRGDYEKSSEFWSISLKAAERSKSYFSIITNSINLSLIHKLLHQYERALQIFAKAQPYLERVNASRENCKINLLYADMLMEVGDFAGAFAHMEDAAEFYESRESLRVSYEYYDVMVSLLYLTKGKKAAEAYVRSIAKRFTGEEDEVYLSHPLMTLAHVAFCAGDYPLARQYIERIDPEKFDADEDSNAETYNIVRYLTGVSESFEESVESRFAGYSLSLLRLHAMVVSRTERDALFFEYAGEMLLIMKNWLANIPFQYRDSFVENNAEWGCHYRFLKGLGYDPVGFDPEIYHNIHRKNAERHLIAHKKAVLLDYRMSPMSRGEELYDSLLRKFLDLSGMTRGAYFEYDMYKGWQNILSVETAPRFHAPVPMRTELLNEILFEDTHTEILWQAEKNPNGKNLTGIMIIPILDIEKLGRNKQAGQESRQSSFHYFALKGCFYMDTTRLLLYPGREIVDGLGPLRDYVNAAAYYEYLKETALLDKLTGLYKREHWIDLSRKNLEFCRKNDQRLVVTIMDLDHFKNINDRYGHSRGDNVLRDMGNLVKKTVRTADIVGRYGGEEISLTMLIPHGVSPGKIVDRVRSVVERSSMNQKYNLTCSLGYAVYPEDGNDLETLTEQADAALFYAKKTGRNRTVRCTEIPPEETGDTYRKKNIIDDPVREKEKIAALLALEEIESCSYKTPALMNTVYDILVEMFRVDRFHVYVTRGGKTEFFGKDASEEYAGRPAVDMPEEYRAGDYSFGPDTAVSVFMEINSERYSMKRDRPYFALLGRAVARLVYLSGC